MLSNLRMERRRTQQLQFPLLKNIENKSESLKKQLGDEQRQQLGTFPRHMTAQRRGNAKFDIQSLPGLLQISSTLNQIICLLPLMRIENR